MRDLETISTALHAAETGHMVFSTLHTLDAVETVNRIIAVFPPPEQKQIRLQLAATLRAVISQRLVKRCDGAGRVPAVEVLISTAYIRECIIVPEKTRNIREALPPGTSQYGMQTFDQSLYDLFQQGLISYETALENASNPDDFKLRVQGISSSSEPPARRCTRPPCPAWANTRDQVHGRQPAQSRLRRSGALGLRPRRPGAAHALRGRFETPAAAARR